MKLMKLFNCAAAISTFFVGCRGFQRTEGKLTGFSAQGWKMIGKREVTLIKDYDVIPVTLLKGTYKRVMLVVHNSSLEMYDIKVTFSNGETFSPATRLIFAEDTRSRVIDLPGFKRVIKKVEFKYKSRNLRTGRALIELWAKK